MEYEFTDKSKYMVRHTRGIHVDYRYPDPVIVDYYFDDWESMNEFVTKYMENHSDLDSREIIFIIEIARHYKVEIFEVVKNVRVVGV